GKVIRTDPAAGEMAEVGSTIDVFVSVGSELIPVPVVVGLTEDDARRTIEDAGLMVGDVELRPDAEFEEGIVIASSPVAGVEIGPSIPVDLIVSSGPEVVVLPDVTNMSERDATAELTDLGLLVRANDEFNNDVAEGDVIRQDPEAGTEMFSGDTVLLIVSLGRAPVQVPDLTGMTSEEAEVALQEVNLVLRVSNSTQPVADEAQHGRVVDQIPEPGVTVEQEETVTVTLGEFTPPTTTTLPPTTSTSSDPGNNGSGGGG
ncbi:MAG: PASTA domain-containing protein, partial [Acidimicrobiia bacterium]